jgi:D-glycero-alpha-D-manno-heptose-7-phosphate kinase
MPPLTTIHSRAPIRVCDNGGWTDTWFAQRGRIFNIAVSPNAEVQVDVHPRGTRPHQVEVLAENYGEHFVHSDDWKHHPMLEAAVTYMRIPADLALNISIFCEVPAGASTGTSAAVTVALLAALDAVRGRRLSAHELAYAAQAVETQLLKRQCGIQDQLAAAYGGICYIDMFAYPNASVSRLTLPEHTLNELNRRLLLIFLGKTHNSSHVHEKVIRDLEDAGPDDPRIEALRKTAPKSRDALFANDFAALGRAMIENTEGQAGLNAALVGSDARRVIEIAKAYGALGWKVNGAGGEGGSVTLLAGPDAGAARELARQISAAGPYVRVPTTLSSAGVQVWEG